MTGFLPSLAAVAGILLVAAASGWAAARGLLPSGEAFRAERLAWGFAAGLLMLAGLTPLAFLAGVRPGWGPFLFLCLSAAAVGRLVRPAAASALGGGAPSAAARLYGLLLALGVLLYLLRALTEPMWAADYLAIWGFKGKTIFGAASVPDRLWRDPELSFTHPEYPLGLPFLYSGVAFLLGGWDDHALALLFPFLQAATLFLLWGWLCRRGAPRAVAMGAAALLALLEPLYRAFTTGMAEVPLSFFLLLLGTSLADGLAGGKGASRRVALAALAAAAVKNEGLFAAGVAAVLALAARRVPWRVRGSVAAAALAPAFLVFAAHRLWRGDLPLRDFRFALFFSGGFPARLALGLRTILAEVALPVWPALAAAALLLAAGRRSRDGDLLLALAALPLAAYLVLPAFCVWGPDWLVRTAFARTAAALAPLAVAGAALRLNPLFGNREPAAGNRTS